MAFTANTEELRDVMIGVTNETLDSYRYFNKYKQGMKDLANRLNNIESDLQSELIITPDYFQFKSFGNIIRHNWTNEEKRLMKKEIKKSQLVAYHFHKLGVRRLVLGYIAPREEMELLEKRLAEIKFVQNPDRDLQKEFAYEITREIERIARTEKCSFHEAKKQLIMELRERPIFKNTKSYDTRGFERLLSYPLVKKIQERQQHSIDPYEAQIGITTRKSKDEILIANIYYGIDKKNNITPITRVIAAVDVGKIEKEKVLSVEEYNQELKKEIEKLEKTLTEKQKRRVNDNCKRNRYHYREIPKEYQNETEILVRRINKIYKDMPINKKERMLMEAISGNDELKNEINEKGKAIEKIEKQEKIRKLKAELARKNS